MLTTINATPILKGKDAKRFRENLVDTVNSMVNPTPEEINNVEKERKEMQRCYELMKSISGESFY